MYNNVTRYNGAYIKMRTATSTAATGKEKKIFDDIHRIKEGIHKGKELKIGY